MITIIIVTSMSTRFSMIEFSWPSLTGFDEIKWNKWSRKKKLKVEKKKKN
jgi:hypothetical protein